MSDQDLVTIAMLAIMLIVAIYVVKSSTTIITSIPRTIDSLVKILLIVGVKLLVGVHHLYNYMMERRAKASTTTTIAAPDVVQAEPQIQPERQDAVPQGDEVNYNIPTVIRNGTFGCVNGQMMNLITARPVFLPTEDEDAGLEQLILAL
jgi:hypothetical protein